MRAHRSTVLGVATFLSVVAIGWWVVGTYRPDEDSIPRVAARPGPALGAVEGLRVDASDVLPGWTAERAEPSASGSIGIAGSFDALTLERVEVDLGDGVRVSAARGRADLEHLQLTENVVLWRGDDSRALLASELRFDAGGAHVAGLAVHDPDGPERRQQLDPRFASIDQLRALATR